MSQEVIHVRIKGAHPYFISRRVVVLEDRETGERETLHDAFEILAERNYRTSMRFTEGKRKGDVLAISEYATFVSEAQRVG